MKPDRLTALMRQLKKGWENEHLATYLLSRTSFVAKPLTVADDIGADLYCTLFEAITDGRRPALVPKNFITVQVKSSARPIDVTKKRNYFEGLDVPYYIGVVRRQELALDLYSGRYISLFRSSVDWPTRFRLLPVPPLSGPEYRKHDIGKNHYDLYCPLVATLQARDTDDTLRTTNEALRKDATAATRAIVSQFGGEFIFDTPGDPVIVSGPGSAEVFRHNFYKRLAQTFQSLRWLATHGGVDVAEVASFVRVYRLLEDRVPSDLKSVIVNALGVLESKAPLE